MADYVEGVPEAMAAIDAMVAAVLAANKVAVKKGSALIEARAIKNSKGRPGPNVKSGTHWRSIHVEGPVTTGAGVVSAQIGPSEIYSRRLELGYTGTDSLGRSYHQPAFPYLRPAVDKSQGDIEDIFEAAWATALEGA